MASGQRQRAWTALICGVLLFSAGATPAAAVDGRNEKGPAARYPDQPRVVERSPIEFQLPPDGGASRGSGGDALDPSIDLRPATTEGARPPTKRTELALERSERTTSWANPDGTITMESSPERIRYRDTAGQWQQIDLSLVDSLGDGFDLAVRGTDRTIRLATKDPEQALAEVGGDLGAVRLRAIDFAGGLVVPRSAQPAESPTPSEAPTASSEPPEPAASPEPSLEPIAPSAPPEPSPSGSVVDPSAGPSGNAPPSVKPTPEALPAESAAAALASPSASLSHAPEPSAAPSTSPTPTPFPEQTPSPTSGPSPADTRDGGLVFVADPGAGRISLAPTDTGVEFRVVLDNPSQRGTYSFALDIGGLEATIGEDGSIDLTEVTRDDGLTARTEAGRIGEPTLFDESGLGAPKSAVRVSLYRPGLDTAIPAEVSPEALASLAPGEVVVTYVIDPTWLRAPGRAFPVTLDPTVCMRVGDGSCSVGGYVDHYLQQGFPDTYAVPSTWLRAGYSAAGDSFQNMRSLVWFENVALPDAAHVTTATLTLREDQNFDTSFAPDIQARMVSSVWSTVSTWSQRAASVKSAYDSPSVDPCSTGTTDCDVTLDVEKIVRAWYTRRGQDWKPNIGFQVRYATESSSLEETRFFLGSNATVSNRPKLTITYEAPTVQLDFAPELGGSYSPSTMVAGQATTLPIKLTNSSGFTWNTTPASGLSYRVGYRWFDAKGAVISSGTQVLPAAVATGANTGVFSLAVTPPASPGQYSLRLDLVHDDSGLPLWASDWAKPSLFLARNKKVLSIDATRWTGKSAIERADFSVNVVRGGGTNTGEQRSVGLGDGSTLSLDLYGRNVHFDGAGGLEFDDLLPMGVSYGYDSKHAIDCAAQKSPTLRDATNSACGWYTNWDERLTPGSAAGSYVYQGSSGNRYLVDTDGTGQLISNAPIRLERTRYTIFDEHILPSSTATIQTAASQTIPDWAGSYVLMAPSNASTGVGTIGTVDLSTYSRLRFAARTGSAVSAGLAAKIHNASNTEDYPDRWIVLTLGTGWTSGFEQVALGGTVAGTWTYYDADLYAAVKANPLFGAPTDAFTVIGMQIQSSSAGNVGNTYLDGVRFEGMDSSIIADTVPSFTSNGGNAVLSADVPTLPVANTNAVKVWPSTLSAAPECASPCMSATAGDLYARPFVSWWWRKAGGSAVAMEFSLKDLRTNATGKITYYAGPIAPPGAVNPIQVSAEVPTLWTHVNRNVLDDGRQVLNFYLDSPISTSPSAPPAQGPIPDEVKWTAYRLWAVDGTFAVFDHVRNTSVTDTGEAGAGHPNVAGDTTFTSDFAATYADGSRHEFNADGLLERVTDRDGNKINLDWSVNATKTDQSAYTLITIHGPSDGLTSGFGTYDRDLTYSVGTGSVTFAERVGVVGSTSGRSLTFTFDANNDLTRVKPARTPTCAGSDPTGCLAYSYTDTTNHRLASIRDLRYTPTNDDRTIIGWSGADPMSIRDSAPAVDQYLLRVLNYAATLGAPASQRVLWQDAAAIRANAAIYTDLIADGSMLIDYVPLACLASDCTNPANYPGTGSLSSNKRSASEFDGLARTSTSIDFARPSQDQVITRQGTRAGARLDNYNDPLKGGQVAWSQSADQSFTSAKLSLGTRPDLYRTEQTTDEDGNQTALAVPSWNARPDFSGATLGTTVNYAALRGYWRLGETSGTSATDGSQYANSGTYAYGVILSRPSALINDSNLSAGFDGANDVVTLADIGTISSNFTVSAWAKPDTTGTLAILGTRDTADYGFVMKLVGGTTLRAEIGTGASPWLTQTADAPIVYQAGRWYHVAYAITPTSWTAYVDGTPVAQGTLSGTPLFTNSTHKLRIGSNGRTSAAEPFDGDIDEVAVWSQALTSPQIRMLYLSGASMAVDTARTLYDDEGHSIQTDDQFLASPGFESGTSEWDLSGGGSGGALYLATSETDPLVHQPADPEAPHSWASFRTGSDGAARQDVALVPGQTFRFQVWARRPSGAGTASIAVWYWKRSLNAWTNLVTSAPGPTTWTGYAWDLTLPLDTDGRVRVTLSEVGATDVYFDDAAIVTSLARTGYWLNGLTQYSYTFSPDPASGIPEIVARPTYAATADHPGIFPTTMTLNYVDETYDPAAPDTDVSATTRFDPWGRPTLVTDPDGVTSETFYAASLNGIATDVAWTKDGLGYLTLYAYDLAGHRTSVDPPVVGATTTTYDQLGRVLLTTPPSPGTPTLNEYDGQGFLTRTIANYINGTGSGPTGVDDIATAFTYDSSGRTTSVIGNDGASLGMRAKRSVETYDLLGNPTASSNWSTDSGSFGGQRQTTAYHELWGGRARPAIAGTRGPGTLVPTGSPAPLCPDGGTNYCNAVTGFDFNGLALTTIDAYGKVARVFRDLAGREVFSVANYADGIYSSAASDTDLLTITRYDILGRADETVDVLNRSTRITFDGVGRAIQSTDYDDVGAAVSKTKTVYTAGGRVDRASAPGAVGDADSAMAWTKSVYDGAGRLTTSFAHWDPAGSAPMELESFEAPETDLTLANDGIAEAWTTSGTFLTAGATIARNTAAATAKSGASRLEVTVPATTNTGVAWNLDGTYKGSGSDYRVRVWVNPPAGMTLLATLGNASDSSTATLAGTGAWLPLDVSWDPSADRTSVRLAVAKTTSSAGTFAVDNAIVWDTLHVDSGVPSETVFDAAGRVIASVLPPGEPGATTAEEAFVTRTAYDDLGRVTSITASEVAGAGTTVDANLDSSSAYDALGRLTSSTDSTGTLTKHVYDRLGRLTETWLNYVNGTPTDGTTVDDDVASSFAYDAASELIGYCPAVQYATAGDPCDVASASEPQAWHYAFDDAGHQIKQLPPVNGLGRELANRFSTYDAGGRLTKVCDDIASSCIVPGTASKSRYSVPTYDGVGRVTDLGTYQGWTPAGLKLKTTTSYFGDGQVDAVTAYGGTSGTTLIDTLTASYDSIGRPNQLLDGTTVLADYAWNPDGTLASRIDGSASGPVGTTSFSYDWADRIASVSLPSGWTTAAAATFAWRADGLIQNRTWNGGAGAAFTYDRAKRPIGITKGTKTFGQTYDRDGNVTSESRSLGGTGDAVAGTQSFAYDALNRVISSTGLGAGNNLTYRYDLDGNRTYKSDGTTTWTYGYDRTDQLASLDGGPKTFAYDAFGNMIAKWEDDKTTQTNFLYDLADRLTTIDSTLDATFTFDALGRNATRVITGSTEIYAYVGTSETVSRIQALAVSDTDSIVDPAGNRLGVRVQTLSADTVNWFLPDLHGNIAASLSEDEATVVDATRYDAYGEILAKSGSGAVGAGVWAYQGRLNLSPSGVDPLYDMSARNYAPSTGTFTSLDSVMGAAQNPLSMNRFLYALGNPASLIDPTGHVAISQGQLCGPYSDYCGNTTKPSSPNGPKANKNSAATQANQAPGCSPTCPKVAKEKAPTEATVKSVPTSLPWTIRYGAALADIRSGLTPYDKGWEDVATYCQVDACPGPQTLHGALDELGMLPVLGTPADLLNAVEYAKELDLLGVFTSLLSVLPFGDLAKGFKHLGPHADEVIDAVDGHLNDVDGIPLGSWPKGTHNTYRANLIKFTGGAPPASHAHHIFPKQFTKQFADAGLANINDPRIMSWWKGADHLRNAREYNIRWDDFFFVHKNDRRDSAFRDLVIEFGRSSMQFFGQTVGF